LELTSNSSITDPQGGVTGKFACAVFLFGGDIATVCEADDTLHRLRGGTQGPCHVPDRMQVGLMIQATTIPRSAQNSALGKHMAVPYGALL